MHFTHPRDYNSRYSGTFIGVPTDGAVRPFYVETTDGGRPDTLRFLGRYQGVDGRAQGGVEAIPVHQEGLILSPPKLGLTSDDGTLVYTYRKPHRRWKQGLSLDSTSNKWFVQAVDGDSINVHKVFNPEYSNLDDALRVAVGINRRGFAINRYLGIVSSEREGHAFITYRSNRVGDYRAQDSTAVLLPEYRSLMDTLGRAGFINVQVKEDEQ